MKILQLLKQKQSDLAGCKPITVAFLGDSVTQGCFECYETSPESVETVFEAKSAYSARFKELLNLLYPSVQINIVNSGISGDYASGGFARLERDVLSYSPDLAVVSYGLNDSCNGAEKIGEYTEKRRNDVSHAELYEYRRQPAPERRIVCAACEKLRGGAKRRRAESVFRSGKKGVRRVRNSRLRDLFRVGENGAGGGERYRTACE